MNCEEELELPSFQDQEQEQQVLLTPNLENTNIETTCCSCVNCGKLMKSESDSHYSIIDAITEDLVNLRYRMAVEEGERTCDLSCWLGYIEFAFEEAPWIFNAIAARLEKKQEAKTIVTPISSTETIMRIRTLKRKIQEEGDRVKRSRLEEKTTAMID